MQHRSLAGLAALAVASLANSVSASAHAELADDFAMMGMGSPLQGVVHPHLDILEQRDLDERDCDDEEDDQPKAMKLIRNMQGKDFFDDFNFFNYPDPTNGMVNYLAREDAMNKGLAYVNAQGHAVIRVDDTQDLATGQFRDSVRITTKERMKKGQMVVLNAVHMPYGCATWPAFWTNGPDWPNGGEIDIVEGVNKNVYNAVTLHTADGCTLQQPFEAKGELVNSPNCYAYATSNEGCGIRDPSWQSFGNGFNQEGGSWAMYIDDEGIKSWFFPQGKIPEDLRRARPVPSTWGTPSAAFSGDTCDMDKFFGDQDIIINTTLCGDWAGAESVFSAQCPGTCEGWVRYGNNFRNALYVAARISNTVLNHTNTQDLKLGDSKCPRL